MTGPILTLVYPGPYANRQLAALDLPGGTARHLLQRTLPQELTAVGYAAALWRDWDLATVPASAIVSYCTAGQFARELSRAYARAGGPEPRIVCVNPEFPTLELLVRTVEAALPCPLPRPGGAELTLEDFTPELVEHLRQNLTEAFRAKVGGSGSVVRDLVRMQLDWVTHLVAATRTAGPADLSGELHLTAADHRCATACPARHEVVCDHSDDLFSVPAVRAAVLHPPDPAASRVRSGGSPGAAGRPRPRAAAP